MGFRELQSEMSDRDPCSSFVMELAWPTWGVPLLLTCRSVSVLGDSIDSGGRLVSRQRFCFWSPQVCPGEAGSRSHAVALWFLCPACGSGWSCGSGGPCPGHVPSDQEPFRRAAHVSSVRVRLICIKWKRERFSHSAILPFPIGVSFPNCCFLFLK